MDRGVRAASNEQAREAYRVTRVGYGREGGLGSTSFYPLATKGCPARLGGGVCPYGSTKAVCVHGLGA